MTGAVTNNLSGGPCSADCKSDAANRSKPPSTSVRIAKASAECRGNAAGGVL